MGARWLGATDDQFSSDEQGLGGGEHGMVSGSGYYYARSG